MLLPGKKTCWMESAVGTPLLFASWIFLSGFSSTGQHATPQGAAGDSLRLGLSLSGAVGPCFGCSANSDQECFALAGELWAGFSFTSNHSLRLRLSWMSGMATAAGGDHHDFAGNQYAGATAEYWLSNDAGTLALLAGGEASLWQRNNQESFELYALTPFIGGVWAMRNPGRVRPYLAVRLGASVIPVVGVYASLGAGLEIPLAGGSRLSTEWTASFMPSEESWASLGLGIGWQY